MACGSWRRAAWWAFLRTVRDNCLAHAQPICARNLRKLLQDARGPQWDDMCGMSGFYLLFILMVNREGGM